MESDVVVQSRHGSEQRRGGDAVGRNGVERRLCGAARMAHGGRRASCLAPVSLRLVRVQPAFQHAALVSQSVFRCRFLLYASEKAEVALCVDELVGRADSKFVTHNVPKEWAYVASADVAQFLCSFLTLARFVCFVHSAFFNTANVINDGIERPSNMKVETIDTCMMI